MDPSAPLCFVYDSLKQETPIQNFTPGEDWYAHNAQDKLTAKYDLIPTTGNLPPRFCDIGRYQILGKVKDTYNTEGYLEARNAMNPFEQIGNSIFINRAAIKLANIDAVHHVTNKIFTFDNKSSDDTFTFCDVAAGPGGFTQYIQYRFPNAKGYGMTLRHEKLDWNTRFLDMTRFTSFYGPDNTGNLYTNWNHFIKLVLKQYANGVDLVTGDGGFDLEDATDKTVFNKQEFLSSRLLLTQALVGIGCTRVHGTFVVKVFDTVTDVSAQILFILAQCFQHIIVFKPVSSRPANSERYVICMDRNPSVETYFQLLSNAAAYYQDNAYISNLFSEPLPTKFEQWLTFNNMLSINNQLQAAQNILQYLQGTQNSEIPAYDIHKFLIIWNLPDTPINARNSIINVR